MPPNRIGTPDARPRRHALRQAGELAEGQKSAEFKHHFTLPPSSARQEKWVQPLLLQGFFGALNEGMQPLLPINGPAQLKEKLEHILTVCWMNSH